MFVGGSALYDRPRTDPLRGDEIHSDCDSEGNDPPKGDNVKYVDPLTVEDYYVAPPRTQGEIRLPYYMPKERPRIRENFEPKVSYEEWVEGEIGQNRQRGGPGAAGIQRREIKRLEEDSDLPVGKPYFWHAFCRECGTTYHPHVPGSWSCPRCQKRVWQQPDDPESKTCANCRRPMAKMREVGSHKLRNPMTRNPHMCKRCGRMVCDQCYSPIAKNLSEWGYSEPQRVCITCEEDVMVKPPSEEDLGTLHEETVQDTLDAALFQPFWPPKCTRCNISYGKPPFRWQCTSCRLPVWQSMESVEATKCWICQASFPKVRCHKCGQLVCIACGAYQQPLPEMGFDDGYGVSVCKACYEGVSVKPPEVAPTAVEDFKPKIWTPQCPVCKSSPGQPPKEWLSTCHRRKCWQPPDVPQSKKCAVCAVAIAEGTRENCRNCGRLVCMPCAQYQQPVPDRGFAKGAAQIVCRSCFDPKKGLLPDHTDFPHWPPRCPVCDRTYATPPDRWRCAAGCGLVWQPVELLASKACFTCGGKIAGGAVNCRMCGRIVCAACGEGRQEVTERGFTRGVTYPVCIQCFPPKKAPAPGAPGATAPTAGAASGSAPRR